MKHVSAKDAVAVVESGHRVYLHEASMVPIDLVSALVQRREELSDVEIVHLHTDGPAPYTNAECAKSFRHNALFAGPNVRAAIEAGRADFTPVFLSEIPSIFSDGTLPIDVTFIQVSPPDDHGFCRLGLSIATALSAVEHAKIVVAEVNPQVPRTMGESAVHVSEIDYAVEVNRPLPTVDPAPFGAVEEAIGRNVAALVPDGATLQVGIGNVPNAVMAALEGHKDLGLHTEMMSDGLVELIESGAINNRLKRRFERRGVCSFAMGSAKLHDFLDGNPLIEMHPSHIVNDPNEVGKQHLMTSINSAIEIDITGQVCADSVGERIFSGIGGQMDFVQGSLRSPGGKAIIALPSTTRGGKISRIVPQLRPGAGVVTTRGHVHWVVTEHGAVNLRGRTLRERAKLLTSIAHPDFRAGLRAAAAARNLC
jgi:acyl-CoA hydrolase